MLIEPCHIGPRARAPLRWCRALTTDTDGIETRGIARQDRFETDVAGPASEVMIDVAEALAAPPANIPQRHAAGVRTVTAVVLALDMKVLQMLATPREGDVQDVVEMRERRVTRPSESDAVTRGNGILKRLESQGLLSKRRRPLIGAHARRG
jgi:hypothetical protein